MSFPSLLSCSHLHAEAEDQVALNEQFMVASLHPETPRADAKSPRDVRDVQAADSRNRVLRILMSRLGSSMTFGENLIFMLNRAGMYFTPCSTMIFAQGLLDRTPEDLVMQLLVLKLLYLLFNTKGTAEYFYTNDLCVLVDVFLREILDLDEQSESVSTTSLCDITLLIICSYDTPIFVSSIPS